MALRTTTDTATILDLVGRALATDPVVNTVYSSVDAALRSPDGAGWCAHPADDPTVLAVRSNEHSPLALTAGWTDVSELADAVPAPLGLGGPIVAVEALARALAERGLQETGRTAERLFRCDQLRCDELSAPPGVAGQASAATDDDVEFLAGWYVEFMLEAFERVRPGYQPVPQIRHAMSLGGRPWLWLDAAEIPVAMAVRARAVCGVARIGPVYTVPDHRGRGYGSAVTAAATRHILAEGATPILYTDLANPTSNHIYRELGFRPVGDRLAVAYD